MIYNHNDGYGIELFLPGFQKEDIILEIDEDGILSVNGTIFKIVAVTFKIIFITFK